MKSVSAKILFLQEDLYDSLRWLSAGALAWEAAKANQTVDHQGVLGMYTAVVQARALYEFFYADAREDDDARAKDFTGTWDPERTPLYSQYIARGQPANKRIFHLVYGRAGQSVGSGHDGLDHLKNQVLGFATEVVELSRTFVSSVDATFRPYAVQALQMALVEADHAAGAYGIRNPLT